MSTSTSIHSNAFNFLSFILSQVDPRTGQYTCAISLPELKANDLCGPVVPLQLNFNPLNSADSGFGKGWNLQLSQYDPDSRILSLYTGETFKANPVDNGMEIPEKKLDSFHFHDLGNQRYKVEHKSGLVEILQVGQGQFAMPVQMLSPQGHSVTLEYADFGTVPLLSTIRNADRTELLSLVRSGNTLLVKLHPGSVYEALFVLNILGGETTSIVLPTTDQGLPTENTGSWRFEYIPLSGLTLLKEVYTPTGGHETVTYSGTPHYFPGLTDRSLPRVQSHKRDPGFGQAVIETHYEYDRTGNNFLGYGSGVTWSDDGLDNLYRDSVIRNFQYETREILWDAVSEKAVRTTRRVFNRFHLLVLEEVTQKASAANKDDTLQVTETEYYVDPQADFKDQLAYFQLPKSVTQIWRNAGATVPRHTQVVTSTYDDFGNLLTQVNANGVTETSAWYDALGEDGCPEDPQGFVRNIKSKTITPAPSGYGAAPTLQTRYRYAEYPGLTGNGPWLALSEESLFEGEQVLQKSVFSYINAPGNAFEHGRKLQDAVTLNNLTTTTGYVYSKTRNARAGETVLHTVNTLRGFDGEEKIIQLEHSLLNGEPLLSHDDNDVAIATDYDLLGRVTKETVAPGTPYEASRSYSYTLVNAVGQQAKQSVADVKGVETISWLDGHNRVIKETRRDADGLGGNPQAFREIYQATYNQLDQMTSETVIDWERAKDVKLTSVFNYDDWGEQRSVIRPDGVEEHEVTDPIARTTTEWLEGQGKTVTVNNLFDKPDSVKRIDCGEQMISEHLYHYDGLGRTAEEYDAAGNWTRYEYDAFDRMTKTLLPDSTEVEREYAPHSTEDLPVKISVNGSVLGEQGFDGLDRMVTSITGGRESVYTFEPGQTQPKSVKRPSGVEIGYVYRPELGEDPEQRIAVESTAVYSYDAQNARLLRTEEQDQQGVTHNLVREYFSTGEVKSESRSQTGETTRTMHYEYSRQARLLSYTDVLEQTQVYEYDPQARLIATALGTTRSTFRYDEWSQLKDIETRDGSQQLKTHLEYDDFGREVLRQFDLGGGVIQTLTQVYDEVDRLTQRTLVQGSETLRDERYDYDSRGRLVEYHCTGSQAPEDPYGKTIKSQLFGFDAQDNLDFVETSFEGGRNSSYYEYGNLDDPCQLTAITNTFQPDYPARLEFNYDADGNLLQDEAERVLDYDSLGRLISVSALSGESANSYRYDALDTLSASSTATASESRFYQNGELANQLVGALGSTFVRADGRVLAEQAGAVGKSLLLAVDDKNSVLREASQGGGEDIAYSPYGHRADSSSLSSHLGYNGELREVQTGWYLLGNGYRAFNPLLMRFHSPDVFSPFGAGGENAYTYCLGDPISWTDPTGHMPVGKAISAAVSQLVDTGANVAVVTSKGVSPFAETAVTKGAIATASTSKAVKEPVLLASAVADVPVTPNLSSVSSTAPAKTTGPTNFFSSESMLDLKFLEKKPPGFYDPALVTTPAGVRPNYLKATPAPSPVTSEIVEEARILNGMTKAQQNEYLYLKKISQSKSQWAMDDAYAAKKQLDKLMSKVRKNL
jgi:RHS repeat-associated protein